MPDTSPAVGTLAPPIRLLDANGASVDVAAHVGKSPVVVYFYPKADTPGCTLEACGFRDAVASYQQIGVPVYGISPDPVADVKAFSDKFHLNFPLLADTDHAVSAQYGLWVEKTWMGKTSMGTARSTFIIGRDGKVAHVFEKVKAEGHDQEVLAWLKAHPTA